MKTKALFIVLAITFILIGIVYGGLYYFYNEYTKKVAFLESENVSLKEQIRATKQEIKAVSTSLGDLTGNVKSYSDYLATLNGKVVAQSEQLSSVKVVLFAWQEELNYLKDQVNGIEEVELGTLSVEKVEPDGQQLEE